MVTWTSLTTGGVATYVCDSGFELVGDEMRDCQSNSQWSGEAPICICKFILSHCSCVRMFVSLFVYVSDSKEMLCSER